MSDRCYSFEFEEISDKLCQSRATLKVDSAEAPISIRSVIFDRVCLQNRGLQIRDPRIADVIDLAVAIDCSDRWAPCSAGVSRRIHVRLPVRCHAAFNGEVCKHLEVLLDWLTNDCWTFQFRGLENSRRLVELQRHMWPCSNQGVETEVALWSGGLDSLAGLCNRIADERATRFLLVGTGANQTVRGVQSTVLSSLAERLEDRDLKLMQLFFRHNFADGKRSQCNSLLRARGAVFMLIGAAYAILEGQNSLAVYENGPGAINLPFRASEVGVDHSRAMHPLSLHYVSKLVEVIFDRPFVIHNPFLGWTKAEMCRVLPELYALRAAFETQSCDRARRLKIKQCGTCSSCILRRQSFLATGILDESEYLVNLPDSERPNNVILDSHLQYMQLQADGLRRIFSSDDPWQELVRLHPTLIGDIDAYLPNACDTNGTPLRDVIVKVLKRYADEWALPQVRDHFVCEPSLTTCLGD